MRRTLTGTTTALLLALGGLAGCGGDDAEPAKDYPDDAVRLRQNVPTPVDDYTLTAINLDGDQGIVVVEPPTGGGHTNVPVTEGGTGEAEGLSFEVVDVVEAEDVPDEPGATDGLIVIVPSS
jgi:hypothetical protein